MKLSQDKVLFRIERIHVLKAQIKNLQSLQSDLFLPSMIRDDWGEEIKLKLLEIKNITKYLKEKNVVLDNDVFLD